MALTHRADRLVTPFDRDELASSLPMHMDEPDRSVPTGMGPGGVWALDSDDDLLRIHSGSRGLGHQICSDHVRLMAAAMGRYGIDVPDRQLA